MQPIYFRGKPYTAKKNYLEGTHRIYSPTQTWEKISPLAPHARVTRIADITGLDRIGIPVTLAIRPDSLTLAVSSGKGLTKVSAQVSGLMEALELFSAENCDIPILNLCYNELIQKHEAPTLSKLTYRKLSLFNSNRIESWTLGWDLLQQKEIAVPFQSVSLNFPILRKLGTDNNSFNVSSNGVASGNHFLEALTSGIYEVIERDAITCHLFASKKTFFPKLRLESIPYDSVQKLCSCLESAEITLILSDCTVDTDVPVYMARLYDRRLPHMSGTEGYGAHLDPEIAMLRAITEAIQGRGNVIAGSRDDIFSSDFETSKKYPPQYQLEKILHLYPEQDYSESKVSIGAKSLEEDVHILMKKLKQAEIDQLIVNDLTHPSLGIPVVRVVIPGLEGYYSSTYEPGQRAKKFAALQTEDSSIESSSRGIHLPAGGLA